MFSEIFRNLRQLLRRLAAKAKERRLGVKITNTALEFLNIVRPWENFGSERNHSFFLEAMSV